MTYVANTLLPCAVHYTTCVLESLKPSRVTRGLIMSLYVCGCLNWVNVMNDSRHQVSSNFTSRWTARSGSWTPCATSTRPSPSRRPSSTAIRGGVWTGFRKKCRSETSPSPACTVTWARGSVTSSCESSARVHLGCLLPRTCWPVVSTSSRYVRGIPVFVVVFSVYARVLPLFDRCSCRIRGLPFRQK